MMTCETARPLLPLHPDPGERPEVRDAVADHLRACPACADAWRRLQASWEALGTWDDVAPAPGFADAVHARVRASARRRRHWAPMAAAAAVLLAVTSLFLVPTVTAPGLSSTDIEIVRHLDLLENYELVSAMDALEAGASADDVAPVLDLMPPAESAGGDARKAKEY
jgi:predicted anti-sigma-YlaC factor YlaD